MSKIDKIPSKLAIYTRHLCCIVLGEKKMFYVVKRRNVVLVLLLAVCFVAASLGLAFTGAAQVFFNQSMRKIPVYAVEPDDDKVIALTFDAAWGSDKTEDILRILRENEISDAATFFLVGFWVDRFPELVKKIHEQGIEIGNHSNNHLHMSKLSESEIANEIAAVNDAVYELIGKKPQYFRAPFGEYNDRLLTEVEKSGMVGVQWSVDSLDWKALPAKETCDRVLSRAKSGDIVLFHNNSEYILDILPVVIMGLKAKGFRFVSLDELVAVDNYTIDNNGIQHKAQ
ncbi:MAG: polysaccharide deacetylase family protein [Clostridiaceae bacterium]|nr:polysaccharide deacetylase family protein [Clostridiaceae bacterium]